MRFSWAGGSACAVSWWPLHRLDCTIHSHYDFAAAGAMARGLSSRAAAATAERMQVGQQRLSLHARQPAPMSSPRIRTSQALLPPLPTPTPPTPPLRAGRGNTYWLLRSASGSPLVLPPCDFGPILNFVGPYQGFPVRNCLEPEPLQGGGACLEPESEPAGVSLGTICQCGRAEASPVPLRAHIPHLCSPHCMLWQGAFGKLSVCHAVGRGCARHHTVLPDLPPCLQCPGKGWMVRPLYTMPPNLYRAQRWKFGRQGPGG